MLASEILERTTNELLHSGNLARPPWDTLDTAISDTSTLTVVLEGRLNNVPDNAVLEFYDDSMELGLNKTTASSTLTLQERGYLESTAAASHEVGTRVLVNNPFPRIVLLNALVSVIQSLRAYGLYSRVVDTSKALATNQPVVLDSTAWDTAGDIWWRSGSRWQRLRRGVEYEVLYDPSPIEVQFWVGQTGASLRIPYKKDFSVPDALGDDLDDLDIPVSLQPYLHYGIAAHVLAGREIPTAHSGHIKNALEREGRPIGSYLSVARALENTFINRIALERGRQLESSPVTIEYVR